MNPHSEKDNLSDMVSRIADEMNIHRAIDAIDSPQSNIENEKGFENKISHVYYVSATSDAQKEKAHIHKILQRKNRSLIKHIVPDISNNRYITVICLWDDLYKDDHECQNEFDDVVKMSQRHSNQLRNVIILLRPDIELPDHIPAGTLCLPGFDRVSRELTIFKVVQEEQKR